MSSNNSFSLKISNLCYALNDSRSNGVNCALYDISFKVMSNELCAIMGRSGSGKSTLLDVLSNRKLVGTWSGDICINYHQSDAPQIIRSGDIAYVMQDDLLIPTLTVYETIMYSAWVRLPDGISEEYRQERIKSLLGILGLDHVKDSYVGTAMGGISGRIMMRFIFVCLHAWM
jgi:ABC-type multidrug transport system ATPase subunit